MAGYSEIIFFTML